VPTDHPAKQPSFWPGDETERRCKECGELKPLSKFYPNSRSKNGTRSWHRRCKECQKKASTAWRLRHPERQARSQRKNELKRKYGLTREQYDMMLQAQGGVCAICKGHNQQTNRKSGKRRPLCVDHNRKTGAIRELLCNRCNRHIIGSVENYQGTLRAAEILRAAADYLEKHAKACACGRSH
jgi:hypothetical protein